jgi:hypothetical protein
MLNLPFTNRKDAKNAKKGDRRQQVSKEDLADKGELCIQHSAFII